MKLFHLHNFLCACKLDENHSSTYNITITAIDIFSESHAKEVFFPLSTYIQNVHVILETCKIEVMIMAVVFHLELHFQLSIHIQRHRRENLIDRRKEKMTLSFPVPEVKKRKIIIILDYSTRQLMTQFDHFAKQMIFVSITHINFVISYLCLLFHSVDFEFESFLIFYTR